MTRGSRSAHASAICASVWPAPLGDLVQRADLRQRLVGEQVGRERAVLRLAREPSGMPSRYLSVSIPCASGEKTMQPIAQLAERVEQVRLDPAVEHRVRRLVDEQRRPELAQDRGRLARLLRRVRRDAGVERLALPHRGVERAHRLLERRVRVEAVRVEDVDVVEPHALEALVEAREQVLARAPVAVRAGPHVVAGLGRDDELVAVGPQVARASAGRSSPRPSRTAGRSCSPGRSA